MARKTVEKLYSEHLERVANGRKEEWSAWEFAREVGEVMQKPERPDKSHTPNVMSVSKSN